MNLSLTNNEELERHPWPKIRNVLNLKYEILLYVDLLYNNLDLDLAQLHNLLSAFRDFRFSSNQRIIIIHRDTDYYCSDFGFTLWNLYSLYSFYNIASEYTIILSAYRGIERESKKLAKQFNIPPMQVIYCPYQWCPMPKDVNEMSSGIEQITYPYVCLNGIPRAHRIYTLINLQCQDIIDYGLVTLGNPSPQIQLLESNNKNTTNQVNHNIPLGLHLRTTFPITRINDRIVLTSAQQKKFHSMFADLIQPRTSQYIDGVSNDDGTRYQPKFLQLALWDLITESVGDYPYSFFTEKTWKAILTKRPFILLGGPNSLEDLKKLGFKTFNQWIDEDYASQTTFANRADLAVTALKPFCTMSSTELQKIYFEMLPVIEHNFNHYLQNFGNLDLDYFIKNML